jgi:mono/diheme cytochrome c family protein
MPFVPMSAVAVLVAAFQAPPVTESSSSAPPTWHERIHAIFREHCERCHRDGGAGPFPFTSLEDVAGRAKMIRRVVTERTMPPWFATDASGPFRDDPRLSDDERRDLLAWIEADCPEGDPAHALPPKEWPKGWGIGEPDLVVELPRPIAVPATGVVDYVYVDIPFQSQDAWVQAYEVQCDPPSICHHVEIDVGDPQHRSLDMLGGGLPGKPPTIYPEGMARRILGGSILRFRIHVTPNGKAVDAQVRLAFRFAKTPPTQVVVGRRLNARNLRIPPNSPDSTFSKQRKITKDVDLIAALPHMHLRGKSMIFEIKFPDGRTIRPLELARWHPDWQLDYEFTTPIHVPAGSVIHCTFHFDNSKANPFNPNPDKPVVEGPQIWDEMGGCLLEFIRPVGDVDDDADTDEPPARGGRSSRD